MCEVLENLPLSSLSLDECRRDSPQFRHALSESERELTILQNKYADSASSCRRMVEDGKQFFKSMRIFVDSLDALKPCFADNDKVQDGAAKCLKILCEFREQGIFLLDRFSEAEIKLLSFHQELKKVSETKRYFERSSEELDEALARSMAAVVRLKQPTDFEEPDNMTDACRKSFLHVSIDYVRQIRNLRLMKNSHLLETLIRITDSGLKEYHHQGWDFMNRVSIWSEHIRQQIEFARVQAEEERKRMDSWQRSAFGPAVSPVLSNKSSSGAAPSQSAGNGAVDGFSNSAQADGETASAQTSADGEETSAKASSDIKDTEVHRRQRVMLLTRQGSSNSNIKMSGYLFRKTSKKLARTWVRRWFVLTNNQLKYCKRSEPHQWVTLESDLRLCTAKPNDPLEAPCRRFCFQIISPEHSHHLQAESVEEMKMWVDAFQAGISSQMNTFRRSSTPAGPSSPTLASFSSSAEHLGPSRKASGSFRGPQSSTGSVNSGSSGTGTLAGSAENRFKKEYRANKDRASRTIRALPGNESCAECGADSKWAACNLGITICLECSGGHRSLGVHLSKVRSLFLDEWGPEPLRVMTSLGNVVVNRVFEGTFRLPEPPAASQMPKLKPMSTREMRDAWIRAKWLERRFVAPITIEEVTDLLQFWHKQQQQRQQQLQQQQQQQQSSSPAQSESDTTTPQSPGQTATTPTSKTGDADSISSGVSGGLVLEEGVEQLAAELVKLSPDLLLHRASRIRCLPLMLCAMAHGANVNWADPNDLNRTPLHRAVESGSLAACEFLLLNGAKVVVQDSEGRSPLHLACLLQHKFQVTLFTKRSDLALHAKDKNNQEPLDLALTTGNADIVTILRMLALNEASGEDGMGGDETVIDIFRDFRNRAYLEEDCDRNLMLAPSPFGSETESVVASVASEC